MGLYGLKIVAYTAASEFLPHDILSNSLSQESLYSTARNPI